MHPMEALLLMLLDWLLSGLGRIPRVRVRAHRGVLLGSQEPSIFINVRNKSFAREFEITHVWIASDPPTHILQESRPLPRRLKTDESWETWITIAEIPEQYREEALTLGRVRLGNDKIIDSKAATGVPSGGFVPGA